MFRCFFPSFLHGFDSKLPTIFKEEGDHSITPSSLPLPECWILSFLPWSSYQVHLALVHPPHCCHLLAWQVPPLCWFPITSSTQPCNQREKSVWLVRRCAKSNLKVVTVIFFSFTRIMKRLLNWEINPKEPVTAYNPWSISSICPWSVLNMVMW